MIQDILDSKARFIALVAPTGSGKSLTYMAVQAMAARASKRAAIGNVAFKGVSLTATKQLQGQLEKDFISLNLADVRGMNNYPCIIEPGLRVDEGPCQGGMKCEYQKNGCEYFDRVRNAKWPSTKFVSTNYDWWLYAGIEGVHILTLDEAHDAPNKLADFLSVSISRADLREFCDGSEPEAGFWRYWAQYQYNLLEDRLNNDATPVYGQHNAIARRKRITRLLEKLGRLKTAIDSKWLMEHWVGKTTDGWRWDVIDPSAYREVLCRDIPKVVLVSATIREETLDLLGIPKDAREIREYPSTFPKRNRPVYLVPSARIKYETDAANLQKWRDVIDHILGACLAQGWHGVIHTVSYPRADYLRRYSKYNRQMVLGVQGDGANTIQRFKRAHKDQGVVLVSPVATTGVDFPYDECRFQIICKVPIPPPSPLMKARQKVFRGHSEYIAMQAVVQSTGRGVRAVDDWCLTFLVDDNFRWFLGKNRKKAPGWFNEAVKKLKSVEKAVKLIKDRR